MKGELTGVGEKYRERERGEEGKWQVEMGGGRKLATGG